MIVYGALAPHLPALDPELRILEENLYARRPDTIMVFTDSSDTTRSTCVVHVPADGHITVEGKYLHPDIATATAIRSAHEHDNQFMLTSKNILDDHTIAVLARLTEHLEKIKVVAIGSANRDAAFHFAAGDALERVLTELPQRIALLVCADLARVEPNSLSYDRRRLTALQFDRQLIEHISARKYREALSFGESPSRDIEQSVVNPIALLFGALASHRTHPSMLGYVSPRGTGHAVAVFEIDL